jgi:hypothetical protein
MYMCSPFPIHTANVESLSTRAGPPSLTSSYEAAKSESLVLLDVEIVDQPETERATNFQIRMRLAILRLHRTN